MSDTRYCTWCLKALPPVPEDADYVTALNSYMHEECKADQRDRNARWDRLEREALAGANNLPDELREWFYVWAAGQCCDYCETCDHRNQARKALDFDDPDYTYSWKQRSEYANCVACNGDGFFAALERKIRRPDYDTALKNLKDYLKYPPSDRAWHISSHVFLDGKARDPKGFVIFNLDHRDTSEYEGVDYRGIITWTELLDFLRSGITQTVLF